MGPSDAKALAIFGRLADLPPGEESDRIIELHNLSVTTRNFSVMSVFAIAMFLALPAMYVATLVTERLEVQSLLSGVWLTLIAITYIATLVLVARYFYYRNRAAKLEFSRLIRKREYREAYFSLCQIDRECSLF